MRARILIMGTAVAWATVLPIPAAHAATQCFGVATAHGTNAAEGFVVGDSTEKALDAGGGNDVVYGDPWVTHRDIRLCLGPGNDTVKPIKPSLGPGVPVTKLDGGAGKDTAVIEACFNVRQEIVVKDVERLTIVPCKPGPERPEVDDGD
jgi:hypothetical protein